MYLSPREVNMLHEERVKELQRLSKPFGNPLKSQLVQRVWANLRNMVQHENQTNSVPPASRKAQHST